MPIGAYFGGTSAAQFGYQIAFVFNSLSFFFSAFCIANLQSEKGHFRTADRNLNETKVARPWHEYREGLGYMLKSPLILGIGLIAVGWASGGGAAQVLFTFFSEMVFNRGAQGLGQLWGIAGVGLLIGGIIGNRLGKRISFEALQTHSILLLSAARRSLILFSARCEVGAWHYSSWRSRGGAWPSAPF